MKEAIAKFIAYLDDYQGRAQNTLLAYRADLLQMENVLASHHVGPISPEGFTRDRLEGYVNWLTGQEYRPVYLKNCKG